MLKQVMISGSIIFVGIMAFMYIFQRQLIYFPAQQKPKMEDYHANDMRLVLLYTSDNLVLNAWYKPAINQHATLLYLGLGILLVEYRGYGGNPGSPSEQGLYEDGRAGLRFLQQQGVQFAQLALYGESIGTGVATQLATEHPVCAVVLQSPFTSLADVARSHYPWLMVKPWDRFDSLKRIAAIHAPLLILHGKKDQIVPYGEAVTLFSHALEPKKMVHYEHGTHNNLWDEHDFAKHVIYFINQECA